MLKLYRRTKHCHEYWETWDNGDGTHTVHWGVLGSSGESKVVKPRLFRKPESVIQKEERKRRQEGFEEVSPDDHATLLVEYSVVGFGDNQDLGKRYQLECRLNELLGWTGLGKCDGGSRGMGTMEACCFVVDFELAKFVIQEDLKGTEFSDYTRIYYEDQ